MLGADQHEHVQLATRVKDELLQVRQSLAVLESHRRLAGYDGPNVALPSQRERNRLRCPPWRARGLAARITTLQRELEERLRAYPPTDRDGVVVVLDCLVTATEEQCHISEHAPRGSEDAGPPRTPEDLSAAGALKRRVYARGELLVFDEAAGGACEEHPGKPLWLGSKARFERGTRLRRLADRGENPSGDLLSALTSANPKQIGGVWSDRRRIRCLRDRHPLHRRGDFGRHAAAEQTRFVGETGGVVEPPVE